MNPKNNHKSDEMILTLFLFVGSHISFIIFFFLLSKTQLFYISPLICSLFTFHVSRGRHQITQAPLLPSLLLSLSVFSCSARGQRCCGGRTSKEEEEGALLQTTAQAARTAITTISLLIHSSLTLCFSLLSIVASSAVQYLQNYLPLSFLLT